MQAFILFVTQSPQIYSSNGHMETTLLHFIFDITTALFAHIAQYFRKDPFQCVVAHLLAIVADVERGAIEMARILSSIAIAATQFNYILL